MTTRLSGVSVKRSNTNLTDRSLPHELPATSPTRTVADLGRRPPLVEALVIVDMALHRRITCRAQLESWIESHRGYHGLRGLRRALELAESQLRAQWRRASAIC